MQTCFIFTFILLAGFVAVQAQLGANKPTTKDDEQALAKAKDMIETTLKQKLTQENGYKTNVELSEFKSTKQVVNGLRYNLNWKTTYTYECTKSTYCAKKPSKVESCSASVWKRAGSENLQYVSGREPVCTTSG